MKLFKFENYEHYKKEQVKANVRKLEWTWIQEDTINKIKTFALWINYVVYLFIIEV